MNANNNKSKGTDKPQDFKYDLKAIANSATVENAENFDRIIYTISDNIKAVKYCFSDFETLQLIFCDVAVIKFSIMESKKKAGTKFIVAPSYKGKNGYVDLAYVFDKELLDVINRIVNS